MEELATKLLHKLFDQGEKHGANVRARKPVLTANDLKDYRSNRILAFKEMVEGVLQRAAQHGAVRLEWDGRRDHEKTIERVELQDLNRLAQFLGLTLKSDVVALAEKTLAPYWQRFSVLAEVIGKWKQLKKVRNTLSAEKVQDFVDAITVIDDLNERVTPTGKMIPLRVVSQTLFNDTKRLESLFPVLDILLQDSLDATPRTPLEVCQELGLLKEEQPVRLAGNIKVARTRACDILDAPYACFAADSVLRLDSVPTMILSIENQTTFHMEARNRCEQDALLIYTAGMPSPAWRAMYRRLLSTVPTEVPVYHWGDIDEGGFRIAAAIAQEARHSGHMLQPWMMRPELVPETLRKPASSHTISRMAQYAVRAGWQALSLEIEKSGFVVEQEALALD